MIKKIVCIPDPVLRQKTKEVAFVEGKIDKKTEGILKDMLDTLRAQTDPKGVGLAAPQIGISKKILLLLTNNEPIFYINPEIIFSSKEQISQKIEDKDQFLEGCLSVPTYWGFVDRPFQVRIKFQDIKGQEKEITLEGKESAFFQHEFDHLDGILFIDRILEQGGKIYKQAKDEKGKEILEEVELVK